MLLLDADGQGSALDWADSRAQPLLGLEVSGVEPGRLLQDVRLRAPGYHWGDHRRSAGYRPDHRRRRPRRRPGPDTGKTRPLGRVGRVGHRGCGWKASQETAAGLTQAAFVITMSKRRSRLSQQIDAALDEYGLPVLHARTTDRVAYPQAVIEGKPVLEGRDRTARHEILVLRDEVERLIDDP